MGLRKFALMDEKVEGQDLPGPAESQAEDESAKWADFLSHDDDVEDQDPFEEETPESPAEPLPEEPVVQGEEAPAVPENQELQPAPVVPQQTPITPEQVAEYKDRFRVALEKSYEFSEEESAALQIEPEKVLPKMAARLHMEVLDNVMQHVYGALPNVIQTYTESSTREAKAQETFFGAWPELRGHDAQVLQMGQMFRQLNPNASPEEAVQRIGEMTLAALGKRRAETAGVQAPVVPPAAPFRPAAPGKVSAPATTPNKWEALMDDDD